MKRNTFNAKAQISQFPKMNAELKEQVQALQAHDGNAVMVEAFHKSIEQPLTAQKRAIKEILDNEINSVRPENEAKQMLALQRIVSSDS